MLAPKAPSWIAEFRKFIMKGNVVDLAVGLIIGVAFTGVVSSLVKDVFNPFLGLLTGGLDFSNLFVPSTVSITPTWPTHRKPVPRRLMSASSSIRSFSF